MINRIVIICLVVLLSTLSCIPVSAENNTTDIIVKVDGKTTDFNGTKPYIDSENNVFAPVSVLCSAISADIKPTTEMGVYCVTITKGTKKIKFIANDSNAFVNGKQVKMALKCSYINNILFIPVKFLADNFGIYSMWIPKTKTFQMYTALPKETISRIRNYIDSKYSDVSYGEANEFAINSIETSELSNMLTIEKDWAEKYFSYDYRNIDLNYKNDLRRFYPSRGIFDILDRFILDIKNNKAIAEAKFLTDISLVRRINNTVFTRGIMQIKYAQPTNLNWAAANNYRYNIWYSYDMEISFVINKDKSFTFSNNSFLAFVSQKYAGADTCYKGNYRLYSYVGHNEQIKIDIGLRQNHKTVYITPVEGMIDQTIQLPFGCGIYDITLSQKDRVSGLQNDKYKYFTKLRVNNLEDSDLTYLLPNDLVQSDSPEIVTLANSITKGLTSNMDKTKAIHNWICTNIAFDTDAYFSGKTRDYSALDVLHMKKAMCNGYSNVNAALHRAIGIRTKKINGLAIWSNEGDTWGNVLKTRTNHSWNEILIDGKWIIEDTSWDSGIVNFKTHKFKFKLSYQYFNPTLRQFSLDHRKVDEIE